MEQQIDLKNYGNLPRHIRQSLATTEKSQEKPQPSQQDEGLTDEEIQDIAQGLNQEKDEREEEKQPQAQPATSQENTQKQPLEAKDDNEVSAWKGRLNKEQTAHKETNARLLAEVEARQKAEAKIAEMQQQITAFENAKKAEQVEDTKPKEQPQSKSDVLQFTDDELQELGFLGSAGQKIINRVNQLGSQHNQPQFSQADVEKMIEERMNKERQLNTQQSQQRAFAEALQKQVPTLQGLLNNSAFNEFLESKVIDFAGNNAIALLNFVGEQKRIDMLPQIASLIAEFEQSQQPPKETVTAPPKQGSAVNVQRSGRKAKPSAQTIAKMKALMRAGKVDELRELQDKYDF